LKEESKEGYDYPKPKIQLTLPPVTAKPTPKVTVKAAPEVTYLPPVTVASTYLPPVVTTTQPK
jgi:hypothetical protein